MHPVPSAAVPPYLQVCSFREPSHFPSNHSSLKLGVVVALLTHIQEVLGSNLGYADILRGFTQFPRENPE
jgi:hypothetical protein